MNLVPASVRTLAAGRAVVAFGDGRAEDVRLAPGDPVTLCVRPEAMAIGAAAETGALALPGAVQRRAFLGDLMRSPLPGRLRTNVATSSFGPRSRWRRGAHA